MQSVKSVKSDHYREASIPMPGRRIPDTAKSVRKVLVLQSRPAEVSNRFHKSEIIMSFKTAPFRYSTLVLSGVAVLVLSAAFTTSSRAQQPKPEEQPKRADQPKR